MALRREAEQEGVPFPYRSARAGAPGGVVDLAGDGGAGQPGRDVAGGLTLRVMGDGLGSPEDGRRSGLRNVRERAKALDGLLEPGCAMAPMPVVARRGRTSF